MICALRANERKSHSHDYDPFDFGARELGLMRPWGALIFKELVHQTPNHSSVSDKKSIALWCSGLRSFGRRKSSDGRVDMVPVFMRFAVMWHAGLAAGTP